MVDPYQPRPKDRPTVVPLDVDADLAVLDDGKILAAPDDPADWPRWRDQLAWWRAEARARLGYDDSRYDDETAGCFVTGLVWLWDELLYDHDRGTFTVERLVDHATDEFGGFDGVVLWHAYPIEGIDARLQLDFYRDVPELPDVVAAFRERGVRVFVTYYPWEDGATDDLVSVVSWAGADGVFLDSVKEGRAEIRAALDDLRPGIPLEAESALPLSRVHDHQLSWAQWCADSEVPGVLRAKWFERRHILHHTRRWHRSHLYELQSAFLNGSGILVWECVFGVWVRWSEWDKALLRSMRRVLDGYASWLQSEAWTPLADHPGDVSQVYASRWEHDGSLLWTIVNRGEGIDGVWLETDVVAYDWVELTAGRKLVIETAADGRTRVGGRLPSGGVAAVLAGPAARVAEPRDTTGDGDVQDAAFPVRVAERIPYRRAPAASIPSGFAETGAGRHELVVRHRVRETGLYGEAPYVDEWKPLPPRLHHTGTQHRAVYLGRFAIARSEVTRAEFAEFLAGSGYRPLRPERFLLDWPDGVPPAGTEDNAVTHVDLADARAYARWAGMRLPTEDEWQIAGEAGSLGRGSPYVWNLTESEHTDGRTRFCIVKGGSDFALEGSDWYFDGGPQPPDVSVKLLLAGAGVTRSSSIGFRCAVDVEGTEDS